MKAPAFANHGQPVPLAVVLFIAAFVSMMGCQNQQGSQGDLFLPFMKTRVPPPGTAMPADPYYQGGAQGQPPAATPVYPSTTGPSGTALPPAADRYSPRGGFNLPQSSIDRTKVIDPHKRDAKASSTALAQRTPPSASTSSVAGETQLIAAKEASVDPKKKTASPTSSVAADSTSVAFHDADLIGQAEPSGETRLTLASDGDPAQLKKQVAKSDQQNALRILAISDHPPEKTEKLAAKSDRLRITAGESDTHLSSRVSKEYPEQQVSYEVADESLTSDESTEESDKVASQEAPIEKPVASNGSYAHDPAYVWLRGRLEYSQSQRQWKLRYIPIDGSTDQYGGSVVLGDAAKLKGFKSGDFAAVQGKLVPDSGSSRSFSPRYEVAKIDSANP